ncbi:MAG TPA: sporulation protein YunB [Candidatus Aphodocola excrementigallinarum]|uniref:Sporulation protein YunB n=1 Tax=Candidatus Aphodocola excrementigallinarum TaxID=2840670 RepID=A0A9D1LI84_9FIRM|nr:sporulation protein YunB [Candidatus Aphodocola excrementigallinarum]
MDKIKMLFKNTYIVIFIFLIIFSTIFLIILNKKAMPVIMNYASVQTKKIGIEVLRNTGTDELNELIDNNNLFSVTQNNNGEIESIDFNTRVINDALKIIAKNVRKRLKEVEKGKNLPDEIYESILDKKLKNGIIYEVPVGVVFGNSLLSNIGPKIPVKIKYSGNVSLDIKTRVSEYGLNSALIEVYVLVEVTQRTILPFQSKDIKLSSEIPIVIKVIKGSIPYYLQGINETYSLPMN